MKIDMKKVSLVSIEQTIIEDKTILLLMETYNLSLKEAQEMINNLDLNNL